MSGPARGRPGAVEFDGRAAEERQDDQLVPGRRRPAQRTASTPRHRLRRAQLRRGRPGRRQPARRRAARAVRDRRPQDVRARLRRDDLLGAASSAWATTTTGSSCSPSWGIDAPVGTDAHRAARPATRRSSRSTSRPTAATALSVRGVAREYALATGAAFTDPADLDVPAAERRRLPGRDRGRRAGPRRARLRPVRRARRPRRRRLRALARAGCSAGWSRPGCARSPRRGRHQLRDARASASRCTRSTWPALQGPIVVRRARPGSGCHPGRRRARARPRGPADHRRPATAATGCSALAGVMGGAEHARSAPRPPTSSSRPRTSTRSRWRAPPAGTSCRREASRRFERGVDTDARRRPPPSCAVGLLVEHGGGSRPRRPVTDVDQRAPRAPVRMPRRPARPARRASTYGRARSVRRHLDDRLRGRADVDGAGDARRAPAVLAPGPAASASTSSRRSPGSTVTTRSRRRCRSRPPAAASPRRSGRRRSVGPGARRARPRRGADLPVRRAGGRPTSTACPRTIRGGRRCGWRTRSPRSSRSCAPGCCRPWSRRARRNVGRGAQRPRAVRDRARRRVPSTAHRVAPRPPVDPAADAGGARGRRRRAAAPAPARRGPVDRPARAGRLVRARPAGRLGGRRRRGRSLVGAHPRPEPHRHAGRARALASGPVRADRSTRASSSATRASCTRRSSSALGLPARSCAAELELDALLAAAGGDPACGAGVDVPGRQGGRGAGRGRRRPRGRRSRLHCARAPASCSSPCGCSTSTRAPRSARGASRWPSPCACGRRPDADCGGVGCGP